jgi:hypothetical protein
VSGANLELGLGDDVGPVAPAAEPARSARLSHDRYAFPLRIYAAKIWPEKVSETELKSSVRKLKRWVKIGKEEEDLPPFDDMASMGEWYVRHHRVATIPEYFRKFEQAAPSQTKPVEDEEGEGDPLPEMLLDSESGMNADEGLRQARTLVKATYEQMQVALKAQNLKSYNALRREWQQLVQIQRGWEKDIVKIQEGRGDVLRTRELSKEAVPLFTTLGQSYFNGLLYVLKKYAPQLATDEQRKIALEQRDQTFQHLQGTRFESAWNPGF